MEPAVQAFLILEIFRAFCLLAACLLAYLGYRLFALGIYEKQGELIGKYGKISLTMRQFAPGVFFAFFGVAIACTGFIRKFEAGPPVSGSLKPVDNVAKDVADTVVIKQSEAPNTKNIKHSTPGHPSETNTSAVQSSSPPSREDITEIQNSPQHELTPDQLQMLKQSITVTNDIKQQVGVPQN